MPKPDLSNLDFAGAKQSLVTKQETPPTPELGPDRGVVMDRFMPKSLANAKPQDDPLVSFTLRIPHSYKRKLDELSRSYGVPMSQIVLDILESRLHAIPKAQE